MPSVEGGVGKHSGRLRLGMEYVYLLLLLLVLLWGVDGKGYAIVELSSGWGGEERKVNVMNGL
jgi:hypothetical protein